MLERVWMPASFRAFSFGTILAATVILLALAAVLACQGRGSEHLRALPTADLLAGDWHVTSTTSADTCNLGPAVQPIQGYFSIQANGASFAIGGVCCTFPPWGTGMTDGTVVTIQSNRTVSSSSTCSWRIDEVDAGTVDAVGFTGGASINISAVGDCGPGFPCQIRGAFTAERCPSFGCGVLCLLIPCQDGPLPPPLLSPRG